MVKIKRIVHLSLFLGIVLFVSLYAYNQVMQKAIKQVEFLEKEIYLNKQSRHEQRASRLLDSFKKVAKLTGDYQGKLMGHRLKTAIRTVALQQEMIKNINQIVFINAPSLQKEKFSINKNHRFLLEKTNAIKLYQAYLNYRKELTAIWIPVKGMEDLSFKEVIDQGEFLSQFNNAPVAISKLILLKLRDQVAADAYLVLEDVAPSFHYCGPWF